MKYKMSLLVLLSTIQMIGAQERPPNAQPGKCYAKCLIPDQYEVVQEKYAVYVGEGFEDPLLERKTITLRPSSTSWVKNDEGQMRLQVIEDSSVTFWLVKDTSALKTFEIQTFEKRVLIKAGGFIEWREVLCGEKVVSYTIRQIQAALNKAGYLDEALDGKMTSRTKAALGKYQKERNLPIGNLDFETLDTLGIQY